MESRFRRLVGQRRQKPGFHTHELETYTISYQPASPKSPNPIFVYQSLDRNTHEAQKLEDEASLLKSLSYDSVMPGKTPVFVNKPQKGNGPIKLQTSRRLSSGELLATSQDSRRTLEDIREGDYVIGRKQGRESYTRFSKTSTPLAEGSISPARYTITGRTSPQHMNNAATQASRSTPQPPSKNLLPFDKSSAPIQAAGWSAEMGVSAFLSPKTRNDSYEIRNDSPTGPDRFTPAEPIPLQNATISALWKAEYGRLIKIYGQDGVDRNMIHLDSQPRKRRPSGSSTGASSKPPSIIPESLPRPTLHERKSTESKRSSATSGRSSSYRDDVSDASSFTRASMASSFAASSSHTTHTSFGDFDPPTTREDIRKIVQEMRSTYLRALEAQPPAPTKPKSTKKKKRPKAPKMSSVVAHAMIQPSDVGRTTWHGDDVALDIYADDRKKPRATSYPVQCFGGLSATGDLTATEEPVRRPELQRADSMTLGSLVDGIASRRKVEPSSRPDSQSKQDKVSRPLQVQTVRTGTTSCENDLEVLKLSDETMVPATPRKSNQRPLIPSHSSTGSTAPPISSVMSSSRGAPIRPPPLPISQISLVNCI